MNDEISFRPLLCRAIINRIYTEGLEFDLCDLDEDIQDIVSRYGFFDILTVAEQTHIKDWLTPLALSHEASIIQQSLSEDDEGVSLKDVCFNDSRSSWEVFL